MMSSTMFAKRTIASAMSSNLTQPFISKPPVEVIIGDIDRQHKKKGQGSVVTTAAVVLLAVGGLAGSIVAMASVQAVAVFVAGGICCLTAPTLIHRHSHINSLPMIRSSTAQLRNEVNELLKDVDFLSIAVERLEIEVKIVTEIEQELQSIVEKQGENALEFAHLVKENEEVLVAIQHNLREQFVSEMARLILRSDKNGDMMIDPSEREHLAMRLKIQLQPYGVNLDADLFQQVLNDDNDVGSILKFCANVLYPNVKKNIDQEDSVASSYEDSSSSMTSDQQDDVFFHPKNVPSSTKKLKFAEFCKSLSKMSEEELIKECSEIKMSEEEKLGLFSVSSKYSRGSVQVARGKKLSLVSGVKDKKHRYIRVDNLVREAHTRASDAERRKTVGKCEF